MNADRKILDMFRNDKVSALREAFPDRVERTFVMSLLSETAAEHKAWAKVLKWVWFALGVISTLAVGGAVKVFS